MGSRFLFKGPQGDLRARVGRELKAVSALSAYCFRRDLVGVKDVLAEVKAGFVEVVCAMELTRPIRSVAEVIWPETGG